jgi:hypothetical protein
MYFNGSLIIFVPGGIIDDAAIKPRMLTALCQQKSEANKFQWISPNNPRKNLN